MDATRFSEDELMPAIDAGAEDVSLDGDLLEVITPPGSLGDVRTALEQAGVDLDSAELVMRPTTRVRVEDDQAATLVRLIETLEEHDDVAAVHANFDMDIEVLERVAAA